MRRLRGIISAYFAEIIELYIHERSDWPRFCWSIEALAERLATVRHKQGRLIGSMESLGFKLRQEANFHTLIQDVLKTSEIEGENLNPAQVRSSLARHLGIEIAALKPVDREVDGIVEIMLDATQNFAKPLTNERLFGWHAALFPTGWSGMLRIKPGAWRDDGTGPMQVVSGGIGRERVHFQAPRAELIESEMLSFLQWYEADLKIDPVLKSGIAHLWFVTIHPFDDGNGRIARAIADMALARSEQIPQRFYSMSAQIRAERKAYYDTLERTQKRTMDITLWLQWFLGCLERAIDGAQITLATVLRKARFWEAFAAVSLNNRQKLVLTRLFDGFEGKLTSSKWAKLARCSQDTAHRDITELVDYGILKKDSAGGRSTSYFLAK